MDLSPVPSIYTCPTKQRVGMVRFADIMQKVVKLRPAQSLCDDFVANIGAVLSKANLPQTVELKYRPFIQSYATIDKVREMLQGRR